MFVVTLWVWSVDFCLRQMILHPFTNILGLSVELCDFKEEILLGLFDNPSMFMGFSVFVRRTLTVTQIELTCELSRCYNFNQNLSWMLA